MNVLRPLLQRPFTRRSRVAASVTAHVEIDYLNHRRHLGESRLEARMVEAGTTVQQQQRRHFAHCRSVRPEFRSLDVKEQFYVVYLYPHEAILLSGSMPLHQRG